MGLGPLGRGGARRRTRRRMTAAQSAQQPAQPASQPAPNNIDTTAELEKLAGLKEKGILTEEEFTAKKKQILGL